MWKKGKPGGKDCVRRRRLFKDQSSRNPKGQLKTQPGRKTHPRKKGKLHLKRRAKNFFEVSQACD